MTRRGKELREHILWTAKDVFLEMGFERASMDEVAGRAETSKRSLYAHFESKEKLFLAVIDFVRGLFLSRLRTPADYAEDPADALTLFCGRYLEVLLYQRWIQMIRLSMAEAGRFPEQAAQIFDVVFTQAQTCVSEYLTTTFAISTSAGDASAQQLLAQVLYPRFQRALFGLDPLTERFAPDALAPDFDLTAVRKAVANTLAALGQAPPA